MDTTQNFQFRPLSEKEKEQLVTDSGKAKQILGKEMVLGMAGILSITDYLETIKAENDETKEGEIQSLNAFVTLAVHKILGGELVFNEDDLVILFPSGAYFFPLYYMTLQLEEGPDFSLYKKVIYFQFMNNLQRNGTYKSVAASLTAKLNSTSYDVNEYMQYCAELGRMYVSAYAGKEVAFDEEGVLLAEQFINMFFKMEGAGLTKEYLSAFLGECIIRKVGGLWVEGEYLIKNIQIKDGYLLNPANLVFSQYASAPLENISKYFKELNSADAHKKESLTPLERLEAVNHQMDFLAENVRYRLSQYARKVLAFNEEGVIWLSKYINHIRTQPIENEKGEWNALGIFLGKCIISTYGGVWNSELNVLIDGGMVANPIGKIGKQFNSPDEDNVIALFKAIPIIMNDEYFSK